MTAPVLTLAGGVGGARFAQGLHQIAGGDLTVIVNIGDDFRHMGLAICPDFDTVLYTLTGAADRAQGWGLSGESWRVMDRLGALGGPDWFRLGDLDLATHLLRTHLLETGARPTDVAAHLTRQAGLASRILPPTDAAVPTMVDLGETEVAFQDYFVRLRCAPPVTGFRFDGVDRAALTAEVTQALAATDTVLIAPSNPFVSIDPILAIPGMRAALAGKTVVAVSPIIGGEAVKGPAAKMMRELGLPASAAAVARHYAPLLGGFVLDSRDAALEAEIRAMGLHVLVTDTLMTTDDSRRILAARCLEFARGLAAHA